MDIFWLAVGGATDKRNAILTGRFHAEASVQTHTHASTDVRYVKSADSV